MNNRQMFIVEYDKIAQEYASSSEKHVGKQYAYEYSLFKAIGNLKCKKVLDLACGDGFFSRKLKLAGAKEVVGVDLSSEMIRIAKEKEKNRPLGIKYVVADVIDLGKIGEFDLVVGGFLLHYSKTKEELAKMCKSIYINLKKAGKFVAINNNPENPLAGDRYRKYSDTCESKNTTLNEGDELIIKIWVNNKETCAFLNYYWNRQTYVDAFCKAGLESIRFSHLEVSPEGINRYGTEFWKELYESPYLIIIEATTTVRLRTRKQA